MENTLIRKLADGEKPIGVFVETASSYVVECLGRTGFDYIIIDNEHSPVEAETSADLVRAAEVCGITPLARVREISRPAVLKLLDVGVQGIIVPNVNSVEDAKALVSYSKFSPVGQRGFCPSRKDGWGNDIGGGVPGVMAHFNSEVLLIPQCETVGALESIEDIAALEGVDGIFIGPFDLSISMGIPGDFENPVFLKALQRILDACRGNGKFFMIFSGTSEGVIGGFSKGYDSVTYSAEAGLMIECLRAKLDSIRKDLG